VNVKKRKKRFYVHDDNDDDDDGDGDDDDDDDVIRGDCSWRRTFYWTTMALRHRSVVAAAPQRSLDGRVFSRCSTPPSSRAIFTAPRPAALSPRRASFSPS